MSTQGILGDFGRPFFCLFFGMSTIVGMAEMDPAFIADLLLCGGWLACDADNSVSQ
jgi:hypothetical protein